MTLCLAVNYGGRQEIADAARRLARQAASGALDPAAINDETFAQALDTAGMPDPDLLIRTAGEMRLSNFLLWQTSYAEIWVTETLWPDFGEPDLWTAIRDFSKRQRRYGGLGASEGEE
jgi:undecaprenyl diphosphate synthase